MIGTYTIWRERNPIVRPEIKSRQLYNIIYQYFCIGNCLNNDQKEIILLELVGETTTPSLCNPLGRSVHDKSNVINDIPSLCNSINRIDILTQSLTFINRTNTTTSKYKVIGTEPICWLSQEQLMLRESILSVNFLESTTGIKLPPGLRKQYKIEQND